MRMLSLEVDRTRLMPTIGADDQQFGFALNGKYAFDLSKKLVDTTVNVESLNFRTRIIGRRIESRGLSL